MKSDIDIAIEAAHVGAGILLGYWKNLGKADADVKARNDWVSRADRESEDAIRAFLLAERPADAFLGEESGASRAGAVAEREWIVDPLDGTSNYLQHFPVWSVSIALRQGAEVVAGVVYQPLTSEVYSAEMGAGAFKNGESIRVSDQPGVEGSFLATGFPFRAQKHIDPYMAIFRDVVGISKGVRRAGSAALDLAWTACGVFDGFFELHLASWDFAAGTLLITEAGGIVSDFSGGNAFWTRGNIVGAPPGVHAELLRIIGKHTGEDDLER